MRQANIVIMGKTGTGKSTIVNAIMESDIAPTGLGKPVTLKNNVYSKTMSLRESAVRTLTCKLNLYDTVGLELDSNITIKTLLEIRGYIEKSQNNSTESDANLVWFCVNNRLARFEPYEVDLINKLIYDYEIPFIVVVTQCFSDEKGELERQIQKDFSEITTIRILAQDYKTRAGVFPAFGVSDLLNKSVFDFDKFKVKLLKSKLEKLNRELYISKEKIEEMERRGKAISDDYSDKAMKIGFLPGGCIPFVHGLCIKMLTELDKAFGIKTAEGFGAEIFSNVMLGIIATPFMVVPLLSAAVAKGYVAAVGEGYIEAVKNVVAGSTISEINNQELMAERIRRELLSRK